MKIRAEKARYWAREARLRAKAAAHAYGLVRFKNVGDPDYYLRLGNLLKRRRRFDSAADAFRRSFELNPSMAAYVEFARLCGTKAAFQLVEARKPGSGVDTVYFEIDTLMTWGRAHKTLSGVQRVAVGILQHVLARAEKDPDDCAFVFGSVGREGFWRADPKTVRRLIDAFVGAPVSQDQIVRMVERIERRAVVARPTAGQVLFALWAFHDDTARYARLKQAGVVLGMYVYDLIALTHPEHFEEPVRRSFTLAVGDNFAIFDFALTISEFTAREAQRLQEEFHLRPMPVEAVPLAHPLSEKTRGAPAWDGVIAPLRNRAFVLFVSTIETRKNHLYLVNIWSRFLKAGLDPPDLAFVGKQGWLVGELMARLNATNNLGGRIHILHGVSDSQLETLYRHCLFTTFPSFVEGWGLPVGESLVHGRPCIASNSSSIPEVGGNLVDYVDPHDASQGFEVFRRMIFDSEYRAAREETVRQNFVPRTWAQVTEDLLGAIARLRRLAPKPWRPPFLSQREIFEPGALHREFPIPAHYLSQPLRLILAEPWRIEAGKCAWMRGDRDSLHFSTQLPPDTELTVKLSLVGPPSSEARSVHVAVRSTEPLTLEAMPGTSYPLYSDRPSDCEGEGRVAADGTVKVYFKVSSRPAVPVAPQEFGLGLLSLTYAQGGRRDLNTNEAKDTGTEWKPATASVARV